jgi:serine-protein kinase ATM
MSNLKTVIDQLSSDKLKERQQGIVALRTAFSRDHAVERLDAENEGKPWLAVFQALFQTVLAEKVLYDRKPTAVSERRLKEATSAVRWLTERAMHRLTKRVRQMTRSKCLCS